MYFYGFRSTSQLCFKKDKTSSYPDIIFFYENNILSYSSFSFEELPKKQ